MRNYIDRILNIAVSKKLTVFLIGTVFISIGKIDGDQWLFLSVIYVGTQAVIDLSKEYFKRNDDEDYYGYN
ncbi:hypothetical protein [Candidatus Venteria ishoeyi]|uniref:Uncharacterized protein n=1 Tax=Candidatus Venteria ishoeyi TaxID=1899563 RepID=A0A1H6F6X9_9GAMM|nr:hypothetical protein [Candidatus Venteria ishoeyi]SEH05273.1 Uncharacterised protein [Candidatus Venteria ishoeyi]